MKLKTLKDLPKHEIEIEKDDIDGFYIREDHLREEAIKWIKEDIETAKNELPFGVAKQLINGWIKRFNITEEELK